METINPLKINDWPIKKFLIGIISIQLSLWGIILLDKISFNIPLLRELIGFVYLTFVPGVLIIRIMKLHNLSITQFFCYSVGLSLASVMFIGLFMNTVYPFFGTEQPLNQISLIATFSIFTLILAITSYFIDKNYNKPDFIESRIIINRNILILCLIPFLAIFGTFIFNKSGINTLQLITLIVIIMYPLIVINYLSEKYYALATFIISLTILYYTSLVSNNLWGFDIYGEYSLANLVLENLKWNANLVSSNYNAMLSVAFLPSIYSLILNMKMTWIFKIIYPIFFSIVPLGLFSIYKKQTNHKIALLSVFFIISMYVYYTVMPAVPRQQIAELFLTVLLISLFSDRINKMQKSILIIIFGSSIIVSHYGLSYIFILILILGIIISLIRFGYKTRFKISLSKSESFFIKNRNYIVFVIVFTITWFMYVSGSSIFNAGVNLGNNIFNSITDLFTHSQAANIATREMTLFNSIERYFHLISQFFILVGLITLFKENEFNIKNDFKIFSVASFLVAIAGFTLPFFSSAMNSDRLYHMMLFFLAPLFVLGLLTTIKLMNKLFSKINKKVSIKSYNLVAIFLVIFFLFSSSFIYQICDQPKMGRFALDKNVNFPDINNYEISSGRWLLNKKDKDIPAYLDLNKGIINNYLKDGKSDNLPFFDKLSYSLLNNTDNKHYYIFLGTYNIKNMELFFVNREVGKNVGEVSEKVNISSTKNDFLKIYDNGGSQILINDII